MPYISQKNRKNLDPLIDRLSEEIVKESAEQENAADFAGFLNYACTRLALKVIRLKFKKLSYRIIVTTIGVFKNIADEFYRRVGVPYENKKIAENGDLELYEELSKD